MGIHRNKIIFLWGLLSQLVVADTLSWTAPTTLSDETTITSEITGYKVYKWNGSSYVLDQTIGDSATTTASVSAGKYAVALTFAGGQSGLSGPIDTANWYDALPTPSAANTIENTMSVSAINAEIAGLLAGDTRYFESGTYAFSNTTEHLIVPVTTNGTSGNEINLVAKPGESPVIAGIGWADDDIGPTGEQDGLVRIDGSYIRFYGFDVRDSAESGVIISGSNVLVEECDVHDNWTSGIVIGETPDTNTSILNVTLRWTKARNSRIGGGIYLHQSKAGNHMTDGLTIDRCLMYKNGFDSDGTINLYGGGNSDGFVVFKDAHIPYLTGERNYDTYGRANSVHDLILHQNIAYSNGDDGFDINSGSGTITTQNISYLNSPSGNKGYKTFASILEPQSRIGDIALGSTISIFPAGEIFFYNGDSEIFVSDTITGSSSGATATVDSIDLFTNAGGSWVGGNADGRIGISSLTGSFLYGEDLMVSASPKAKVSPGSQTSGVDARVSGQTLFYNLGETEIVNSDVLTGATSGATATVVVSGVAGDIWSGDWSTNNALGFVYIQAGTLSGSFTDGENLNVLGSKVAEMDFRALDQGFPGGQQNLINISGIHHAQGGSLAQRGVGAGAADPYITTDSYINNLSYYNFTDTTAANSGYGVTATNYFDNNASSPQLNDASYDASDVPTTLTGTTIRDQHRNLWREIMGKIMPTYGGNLYNAGTLDTDYLQVQGADDATSPSDPEDYTKMSWFEGDKITPVPDIGSSQYQYIFPPYNLAVSGTGAGGTLTATNAHFDTFIVGGP